MILQRIMRHIKIFRYFICSMEPLGMEGDWQRFTRIEDYARNHNLAVVMPYGENSFYRDTDAGKDYETYITQELPQVIQWMFPVSKKREDTFIGGLSMGGTVQ